MRHVTKRDGTIDEFKYFLLEESLRRSGASEKSIKNVVDYIQQISTENISTKEIYNMAFKKLEDIERGPAYRYSLRKALFKLGPTGFPFEKFIASLYKKKEFDTQTNVILAGKCIEHEVDVLIKGEERIIFEVKFHNYISKKSDLKTILYVKSRFDDLMANNSLFSKKIDKCVLATNTKFTINAIKYATCAKVNLFGWNYPREYGLRDLIEETKSHPVTCLPSLTTNDAKVLFDIGVITCEDFFNSKDEIKKIKGMQKFNKLNEEAEYLCGSYEYK